MSEEKKTPKPPKTTRIAGIVLRLTREQDAELHRRAKETGIPMSQIVANLSSGVQPSLDNAARALAKVDIGKVALEMKKAELEATIAKLERPDRSGPVGGGK